MDALLFRPSSADGPPEWKVCADDWVDFYQDRGWILLERESAVAAAAADARAEQIEAEEQRWSPPPTRWKPRVKRNGCTGD